MICHKNLSEGSYSYILWRIIINYSTILIGTLWHQSRLQQKNVKKKCSDCSTTCHLDSETAYKIICGQQIYDRVKTMDKWILMSVKRFRHQTVPIFIISMVTAKCISKTCLSTRRDSLPECALPYHITRPGLKVTKQFHAQLWRA